MSYILTVSISSAIHPGIDMRKINFSFYPSFLVSNCLMGNFNLNMVILRIIEVF